MTSIKKLVVTIPAGESYVDTVHGLAAAPEATDFSVTPLTVLGGVDYRVPADQINSSTFRLEIGSVMMEDASFSVQIRYGYTDLSLDYRIKTLTVTIPAGETYVDIAHGLLAAPDAEDFSVTPQTLLGGVDYRLPEDQIDASTFRLELSGALMEDAVFTVQIFYSVSATVAYCTADLVKFFSQIKYEQLGFEDDAAFVAFIESYLIKAAMKLIDNYVGHNFQSNSAALKLDGNGKDVLMIPPPYLPVVDVGSVVVDGVDVSASVKHYPSYIALDGGHFSENNSTHQNVEVTLAYGYDAVPDDVAAVCAQLVANMLADLLRRKLMPDTVAKAMQSNAETVIISGLGKNIQVFTPELRDALDAYKFSYLDVT